MTTEVPGNRIRGLLFVLSAPAGTGKTTLMHMLADEFPCVVQSISYTTRAPRPGEIDGINYHFLSKEEFEEKIASQEFLEYVQLYGHYYGTSKHWVEAQLQQGHHVVLVIDTQGAMLLKQRCQAINTGRGHKLRFCGCSFFRPVICAKKAYLNVCHFFAQITGQKKLHPQNRNLCPRPVYIFIAPPSLEELAQRLVLRNTETAEHIAGRLSVAHDEIAASSAYDYCIVNDDLTEAYQVLKSIIIAEGHRVLPPTEESLHGTK